MLIPSPKERRQFNTTIGHQFLGGGGGGGGHPKQKTTELAGK